MRALPHITVLLGDPSLPDAVKKNGQFNEEDFQAVAILKAALAKLTQYQFSYLTRHENLYSYLEKNPPALIFNLCDEGFQNDPLKELHIPAILEMLNIPYTGAGPACLGLCYDKANVRGIALSMGISVPEEIYFSAPHALPELSSFPMLVKPNQGDSSMGITKNSLVYNQAELGQYIDFLDKLLPGKSVLIQEYLSGTEYSVGLIGNADNFKVLPILEVDYSLLPTDLPPILAYESKWDPDSPYWNDIRYKPAELTSEQVTQLQESAKQLFLHMGCRDYARFDFRANAQGEIKLLEVNPNPGWCWDGKLNLMAQYQNMDYATLLAHILEAFLIRVRKI